MNLVISSSVCDGMVRGAVGAGLGGVPPSAVAEEKRRSAPEGGKWNFVAKDTYAYPVFQEGPRVCLGKEMAFLQMKRVVAGVFRRFGVALAFPDGEEPAYISYLTRKMKGDFPVRIVRGLGISNETRFSGLNYDGD